MRTPPAVLALAALGLALFPAAEASPGPRIAGDAPADAALRAAADHVGPDGCVRSYGECRPGATKTAAIVAAHAGLDPLAWPNRTASVGSWILAHADDLRDGPLRDCDGDVSQEALCSARRVYSLSKSIRAAEALGRDADDLAVPGGGTRDLVAELNENHTAGQYGSPSYVNDDVWALLALRATGWDGPEAREAADFVASNQNDDGGIGYTPGASSSTDTTAAAMAAMAPRNQTAFVDDALAYLEATQVRDGPEAGCFAIQEDREANAASTAWAVQGLVAAGESPLGWAADGATPTECLLRFQAGDGAFANSLDDDQDQTGLAATLDGLVGLAWTPWGDPDLPVEPATRNASVRVGSAVGVEAPHGFLVRGDRTPQETTLEAGGEPGTRQVRGWTWEPTPRPLRVVLDVRPPVPAAPDVAAPSQARHGDPVHVNVTGADPWTDGLRLRLPHGTVLEGRHHELDLPPGRHRVAAVAVNARGEASPPTVRTVHVRNLAPTVAIHGPAHAAADAPASLQASASDPDGDPVQVRWETPDGDRLGTGPNLTLEPGSRSARTVVAVAEDPHGAESTAPHRVEWSVPAPDVAIRGPAQAEAGAVDLAADLTPANPALVDVAWYEDGSRAAAGPEATLHLGPGNHTIRAVAATANGTDEARHHVTVAAPDPEPSSEVPADQDPRSPRDAPGEVSDTRPTSQGGVDGGSTQPAPGPGLIVLLAAAGLGAWVRRW
jgi:hypothetical protein